MKCIGHSESLNLYKYSQCRRQKASSADFLNKNTRFSTGPPINTQEYKITQAEYSATTTPLLHVLEAYMDYIRKFLYI